MHNPTRTTWAALLWLLPLMLVLGCKKMDTAAGAMAPGGYPQESYGYGGDAAGDAGDATVYYFDDDTDLEGEMLSPEGANLSSRARSRHSTLIDTRREFQADTESEAPPPAKPSPEPADPGIEVEAPEQPRDVPKPSAGKRQIIYTATMQVSVYDVSHSIEIVEGLPDRFGGWLHQRLDNQLVLRIPAEQLEAAMQVIAELGVVDYRLLEALDVTAQYTDLESRIRVLTEMQAQLQLLLKQAKSVEQALEIRKALDQITMELELARAHMRELAKSIAFSTLIVRIVARGPEHELPSSNDPFPWVIELGVEATEYR